MHRPGQTWGCRKYQSHHSSWQIKYYFLGKHLKITATMDGQTLMMSWVIMWKMDRHTQCKDPLSCSMRSVSSEFPSPHDVLVSFPNLVCMLSLGCCRQPSFRSGAERVSMRVSNQAVSFFWWALGSTGCATCDFLAQLCHCFMVLVTLIWPWKPKVCKYGMWAEITCNLSL